MNRKSITAGIAIAIGLQMTVLSVEYLGAVYPLWMGQEIRLKAVPVDPRSLFRGNYARLRYQISTIDLKNWGGKQEPRNGETVYIKIKNGPDGLYSFDSAYPEKPESGPFIRGRLQNLRWSERKSGVLYGVEAYFAPKKKAETLEKELRHGGIAIVMVAGNGKATLKDVIPGQ